MSEETKPPMGVKPRWLHNHDRLMELLDACERYSEANKPCDLLWLQEIRDLIKTKHVITREIEHDI